MLIQYSERQPLPEKMRCLHSLVACGILASALAQEQQLLMVFGGRGCEVLQGCDYLNNVTLLSLDGGPPVPECLEDLGPAPKRLYSACQATLGDGMLRLLSYVPISSQWFSQHRKASSCVWRQIL